MTFSVDAVDAHAEGQHGRVVVGGVGVLAAPGATRFEKMKYFEQQADWFRLLMLREPRGYPRSCVNVLLPPTDPRADAGFVIMERSALYATMSGTNLMVVTTVLLETGLLQQSEPVTTLQLEVPAGLIEVRARCEGGRVKLVEFENVPSFATAVDVPVEVPGFGTVPVGVACGGMACAVVAADALGVELAPDQARAVAEAMVAVCGAAREQIGFRHPENDELTEIEAAVVIGTRAARWRSAKSSARRPPGRRLPLQHRPRDPGGRRAGDRAANRRPRLDHGLCEVRAAGRRPLPGGVRDGRHLAGRQCRGRPRSGWRPRGGAASPEAGEPSASHESNAPVRRSRRCTIARGPVSLVHEAACKDDRSARHGRGSSRVGHKGSPTYASPAPLRLISILVRGKAGVEGERARRFFRRAPLPAHTQRKGGSIADHHSALRSPLPKRWPRGRTVCTGNRP